MRVADLPYDAYAVEVLVTTSGDTKGKVGLLTTVSAGGTGRIEPKGSPRVTGAFRIQILSGGTLGVATWRWSSNGGADWSVPAVLGQRPEHALGTTGVIIDFLPGQGPTYFAAGDEWSFSTVGLARVTISAFNVSTPIGRNSTGLVIPSGPAIARDLVIDVAIATSGDLGVATFVFSVNRGAVSAPIVVPPGGNYAISGTGITLTFDPGPGPSYFEAGDAWSIISRGIWSTEISDKPMALQRPEPTGLQLIFEGQGAASPQFLAGDVYTFRSSAPDDILEALYAASDEALAELRSRYRKQAILAWDESVTKNVALIAREALYERKGFNQDEDFRVVQQRAREARMWFNAVGKKMKHPCIVATPLPGILAPRVVLGPDDSEITNGPFGEEGTSQHSSLFWLLR